MNLLPDFDTSIWISLAAVSIAGAALVNKVVGGHNQDRQNLKIICEKRTNQDPAVINLLIKNDGYRDVSFSSYGLSLRWNHRFLFFKHEELIIDAVHEIDGYRKLIPTAHVDYDFEIKNIVVPKLANRGLEGIVEITGFAKSADGRFWRGTGGRSVVQIDIGDWTHQLTRVLNLADLSANS